MHFLEITSVYTSNQARFYHLFNKFYIKYSHLKFI